MQCSKRVARTLSHFQADQFLKANCTPGTFVDESFRPSLGPRPYSSHVQATEIKVDEFVEAYETLIITLDGSADRDDRWMRLQPS